MWKLDCILEIVSFSFKTQWFNYSEKKNCIFHGHITKNEIQGDIDVKNKNKNKNKNTMNEEEKKVLLCVY